MSDCTTLLVAERDDELRPHLIGQLLADGFEARHARTVKEARCRAAYGIHLAAARRARRRNGVMAPAARDPLRRCVGLPVRSSAAGDRALGSARRVCPGTGVRGGL